MRKFKKILSLALSLTLCLSLAAPAFAGDSTNGTEDELLTFEECEAAVVAEYAKYGVEGGLEKPSGDFYCTQSMLDESLEIIRNFIERNYDVLSKIDGYGIAPDQSDHSDIKNDTPNNTVQPQSMYVNVTDYTDTYRTKIIEILPIDWTIRTTATFTVDVQNNYILSGSAPTLEIMSGNCVDDWVELTSYSYNIDNNKHIAKANIQCKVKYSFDGLIGSTWSKIDDAYTCTFTHILDNYS